MMDEFYRKLSKSIQTYDSRRLQAEDSSCTDKYVAYGTAGFRGRADEIQHLFFKVGIIAGLRCLVRRANVGVMVTASHNPIQDNGVKLIEPDGQMLMAEWEPIVERFCNLSLDLIIEDLKKIIGKQPLDLNPKSDCPRVLVGYDTRPSSEFLVDLLLEGLNVWSPYLKARNYYQATTPALHYIVAESNKKGREIELDEYYNQLIDGLSESFNDGDAKLVNYQPDRLIIDCANGIGYRTLDFMSKNEKFHSCIPLKMINTGEGILNQDCGADFVKTKLRPPKNADETNFRYAALDGDADRLVYFFLDNRDGQNQLRLLDGDKIMALYAIYLQDILGKSQLIDELSFGIIQTAYANGASTDFMKNLGLHVDCVDTGVKNLHHKAQDYDIAIYFEANGHGTIWISNKAKGMIEQTTSDAGVKLRRLRKVLNNFTGDAISDALIVELILRHFDMSIQEWYKIYTDRPNSLIKVSVKDRNVVKTTNAGRTCLEPKGLQDEIDSLVQLYAPEARSFVRASGTEDVVRIYAEANTQENADKLAGLVGEKVMNICNAL